MKMEGMLRAKGINSDCDSKNPSEEAIKTNVERDYRKYQLTKGMRGCNSDR
jgi:hypothetical protein